MITTPSEDPVWKSLTAEELARLDQFDLGEDIKHLFDDPSWSSAFYSRYPLSYLIRRTAARRGLLDQSTFWVPHEGWSLFSNLVSETGNIAGALALINEMRELGAATDRFVVRVSEMNRNWRENTARMLGRSTSKLVIGELAAAELLPDLELAEYYTEVFHDGEEHMLAWLHGTPLMRALLAKND